MKIQKHLFRRKFCSRYSKNGRSSCIFTWIQQNSYHTKRTRNVSEKELIFTNFRSAKDFVKSYNNANSLKPSMELAVHINRLVMRDIVDDWDIGKIRGFSEKPNEIYDTWYKVRDFYPNMDMTSHFNELFDWIQNGKDNNHKLIKIGILLYEFLDKAPFTVGNQITAILVAENTL